MGFVAVFMLAGIFGEPMTGPFQDVREVLICVMFPLGVTLSLAAAFKWPRVGGALALLFMAGLFGLRPDLLGNPWFALFFAPPGALFLLSGVLNQSS